MKYLNSEVVFAEVPDEISLAINITGCPYSCEDCHSPWLRKDTGELLDEMTLRGMLANNQGITCVVFMGGDAFEDKLINSLKLIKSMGLKTALYTGSVAVSQQIIDLLDYLKLGPYIKELGDITKPTTNQRFYHVLKGELKDKTNELFHKKNEI